MNATLYVDVGDTVNVIQGSPPVDQTVALAAANAATSAANATITKLNAALDKLAAAATARKTADAATVDGQAELRW